MKKAISAAAACLAIAAASSSANAAVFADDFEAYTVALNTSAFGGNWTVTGGTVDLVGPGSFAELCNVGSKCVDLDGSSGDAGVLASLALSLTGGQTYTASYDLAANRRLGGTDLLTVNFGSASALYSLTSTSTADAFTTFTLNFTPSSTGSYNLSFSTLGGDNVGPLLDNVSVDVAAIPEPATWAMMIMGFAGVGAALRSRRREAALPA